MAEIRIYNPQEKKLDSRITSGFVIGCPEKSKGYRFYCPNHSTIIVEIENARFIENGEVSGSTIEPRKIKIQEVKVQAPLPITSSQVLVRTNVVLDNAQDQHINEDAPHNEAINNEPTMNEPQ